MTPLAFRVLEHLAAGDFQSGARLARAFGVSRGSVWHAVRALEQAGLDVYSVRGRGYRLAQPLSVLDADRVRLLLGARAANFHVELHPVVDSTNTLALQRARAGAPSGTLIATEWQVHGRGRLGRRWHAGIAGALMFSLIWRYAQGAAVLSGLSLAVGIALVRALRQAGVPDIALKWPNDVLWRGLKLAGILIEMQGDALGPTCAVIGVGINVRLTPAVRQNIDQPAADFETALGRGVDRNVLLANVLTELAVVLEIFGQQGFAPFCSEWQRYDACHARAVSLITPDGRIQRGDARGVSRDGAFLVAVDGRVQRFYSGEVSVRSTAPRTAKAGT
ncbi:MAG TPA: biotin--[acetyl-CoA-carboxylase] ligase [Burkholderiales bacterium]|nr:biotin--[acetyl-CoA-carboxylase] ligase [Burkholderiales bacterium]